METKVVEGSGNAGEIVGTDKDGVKIACGKDCVMLVKVKPEGKGEMLAKDWFNGLKNKQVLL